MQSEVLLPNCSGKVSFTGNPVKCIGYDSLKTNKRSFSLAIHTLNFIGRFYLEGTLKLDPKDESDWFPIIIKDDLPYIEYNDSYSLNPDIKRNNEVYTLFGNYTWVRGKMDRDYLNIENEPQKSKYGNIEKIMLCY